MLKALLQIILGFVLGSAGVYLGVLFTQQLNEGLNFFLLIPALILLISGIWLLIRSAKSDAIVGVERPNVQTDLKQQEQGFEKMLEQNNAIDREWEKTNNTRNQLKVLQAAGESDI